MTSRSKAQPNSAEPIATETAAGEQQTKELTASEAIDVEPKVEQTPLCGKPHHLPLLAHITCQLPAPDPDLAPGTPEHEHRHQDGDAVYVWR